MVAEFRISAKRVRVGLVLYSSRPRLVFKFDSFTKKSVVIRAIETMKLACGRRMTGAALQFTYTNLLRGSGRQKVVVLISTGRSRDDVRRPSTLLRNFKAETFAVGVGRTYSFSELAYIATDRSHVFTVGFRNLNNLVGIFRKKICKGWYQQICRHIQKKIHLKVIIKQESL